MITDTCTLRERPSSLLRVEELVVDHRTAEGRVVRAVSGVSFEIQPGETLSLVGESGCGKSTIGRAIMMLRRPTSGSIYYEGRDLTLLKHSELRRTRQRLTMIFQDPISSLNPRRTVNELVSEGLSINKRPKPWDDQVEEVLEAVGLDPGRVGSRRPRELSGGQCQRVAIARALALKPQVIVCDEPVSALDVSIQAQVLNLLEDLKATYSLTLLFIAHDLAVVKSISDRVAVMYLGRLCEIADSSTLYSSPLHPYTQALLSAIPDPDPCVPEPDMRLSGELPSPINPPRGCRFSTRCPRARDVCRTDDPQMEETAPGHFVACHFPGPATEAS